MTSPSVERVLRLEGARNFRDLGGYPTLDGRRLKWRHLFRAGILGALTPNDCQHLASLGLRSICDLRGSRERHRGPSEWSQLSQVTYWARDYENSVGNLHELMESDVSTVAEAREAMFTIYRALPSEQAPAYRELFRLLADGELPLVFNCSAGKDRTGLAAALVLTMLSVPHELIVEDYLLSNTTFTVPPEMQVTHKCSAEVRRILAGVDPSFIETSFLTIAAEHGSVDRYLREALGVSDAMREEIRAHLLEPTE